MTRPAIVFDSVSKVYSLAHQKTETLKAQMTRFLKGGPFSLTSSAEVFYALRDVSFEIQSGESVGIIGPNGSGKSTSLKVLAGVTKPTTGRYELNGKLGALIEVGAGFHPELTGRENVFLNGSILGMKKAEIKRKFDAIVDFAEIEQFIDTPVKHYSSGMYVRLGFSVAVHNEPEIMLVDEVLAVGDLSFQKKCFSKMQEMKAGGRTFILVSHAMPQISAMCNRVILLHKGELIADGPPEDVTERYNELSGTPGRVVSKEAEAPAVEVSAVRLLGPHGDSISSIDIGAPMKFAIDFIAHRQIVSPEVSMNICSRGICIYATHSVASAADFPAFAGPGTLICEVPALPILPNDFNVAIRFYEPGSPRPIGYADFTNLFTIPDPVDTSLLGVVLHPEKNQRTFVFGRATWSFDTKRSVPSHLEPPVVPYVKNASSAA